MPGMTIPIVFAVLLAGSTLYAFWQGGKSQRCVAAIVLAGSICSAVAQSHTLHPWRYGEIGTFAVDLAMLVAFGAIMLTSNRFWPIWMTAAQLLSVIAHLGPVLRHSHIAVPFAISEQIWSWLILVQLVAVTILHRRALVEGHRSHQRP